MTAGSIRFGEAESGARLEIEILGLRHPEVAEPEGLDLLDIRVHADAPPVDAYFDLVLRVEELHELTDYLVRIVSGNGPQEMLALADGLLELRFAPSRRGPVLLGVTLKSVDLSHVRIEYLVTLEPRHISRACAALQAVVAPNNLRG